MTACLPADPSTICDARSFQDAPSLISPSASVLAIAERNGSVTVVRDTCAHESCAFGAELAEQNIELAVDVEQLLLSGDGQHLVVHGDARTQIIDLEADNDRGYQITEGPEGVFALVGALRGGRYAVMRDSMGLIGYDLDTGQSTPIGDADMNLLAVAMGDRHLVARSVTGDGEEDLYLVPVAPDPKYDILRVGTPVRLSSGRTASRVFITRRFDPDEAAKDPYGDGLGHDVAVVVTTGDDPKTARTSIYDVSTGELSAALDGAIMTSPEPLNDIAGLFPVSPDGSSIPYVTARGSLAMHRIGGSSCLVRSNRSGEHRLAGFSASGRLFFESREKNREGFAHDRVYAHDLGASEYAALTPDHRSYHLEAVPARPFVDDDGAQHPWAIAAIEGRSHTVQPGEIPRGLPYDDVAYLPRERFGFADDTLWLFDARDAEESIDTRINMKRVLPVDVAGGTVRFELEDDAPMSCGAADCQGSNDVEPFSRVFTSESQICLTTNRSVGWARSCVPASKRRQLVRTRLPASETPM